MLVTLPLVLLLLDYWPLQRITDFQTLRKLFVEKIPLLALSAALCIATIIAQGGPAGGMEPFPLSWRINNALVSYIAYIGQMFWPVRLAAFYPHPENRLPLWEIILALMFVIAISATAIAPSTHATLFRRRLVLVSGNAGAGYRIVPDRDAGTR